MYFCFVLFFALKLTITYYLNLFLLKWYCYTCHVLLFVHYSNVDLPKPGQV